MPQYPIITNVFWTPCTLAMQFTHCIITLDQHQVSTQLCIHKNDIKDLYFLLYLSCYKLQPRKIVSGKKVLEGNLNSNCVKSLLLTMLTCSILTDPFPVQPVKPQVFIYIYPTLLRTLDFVLMKIHNICSPHVSM